MDFKTYDKIYQDLLNEKGRIDIANEGKEKEALVKKINDFLELYPKSIPKDKDPNARIYQLSLKELFRRYLQTAIDILNDLSEIISRRNYISNATFRRDLFSIFTKKERRLYVGLWIMFFSFVLYFLDSAA
jgi:hypothetical protein